MAQNSYIGVSGKARTIKAINVGVAGKARKVVNGYIGVAGKARPFFSIAKSIKFYQTVDPLKVEVSYLAAASIGNYGLFAGGLRSGDTASSWVTAYNAALQKSTPTALSQSSYDNAGTGNSEYAMFAGGYSNVVTGYSSSLQRSLASLSSLRWALAASHTGDYTHTVFAGGADGQSEIVKNVDSYNASMQRVNTPALTTAVVYAAGGNAGVYAIFAGGQANYGYSTQVTAYNNSLQKSTPAALSVGRASLAAANIINSTDAKCYTLFAGGYTGSNSSLVEAYNDSLQRTILTDGLGAATKDLAGTSCLGYEGGTAVYQAVFAGGYSNIVTIYNSSLQRLTPSAISSSTRPGLAATSVPYSTREYALFGGGNNTAVVDAFTCF